MKIHSFSTVLAIPLVIALGIAFYFIPKHDYTLFYYLLIPLMLLATVYVFHPNIDYWWHTKYPIPLDQRIIALLQKNIPYYVDLSKEEKVKYEYRLGLYMEAREFKMMGAELTEVPEDIKALIAAQAINLTFCHEDFLIGDFDRVYLYKHPFPSPKMKFLHTVETEMEDGMVILSLEHVSAAILAPRENYNIAIHGFVEAFVLVNPDIKYPQLSNDYKEKFEMITGYPYKRIEETLGYEEVDPNLVVITLYFTHTEKLKEILPHVYSQLHTIFGTISLT